MTHLIYKSKEVYKTLNFKFTFSKFCTLLFLLLDQSGNWSLYVWMILVVYVSSGDIINISIDYYIYITHLNKGRKIRMYYDASGSFLLASRHPTVVIHERSFNWAFFASLFLSVYHPRSRCRPMVITLRGFSRTQTSGSMVQRTTDATGRPELVRIEAFGT